MYMYMLYVLYNRHEYVIRCITNYIYIYIYIHMYYNDNDNNNDNDNDNDIEYNRMQLLKT